jgi:hypothetical protein
MKELNIRTKMVEALEKEFADYKLKFSIGGQISMDVFPRKPFYFEMPNHKCLQRVGIKPTV